MTLLELMVALAIGSVLLIGLATVFFNSSRTHRELEKSGQMIENGRYAISVLHEDLRHAGFYGPFSDLADAPPSLPDPCETADMAVIETGMAQPIQGYQATGTTTLPDISTTTCDDALLVVGNLAPGSDVLVLRRTDSAVFTGVINGLNVGAVFMQANALDYQFKVGSSGANVPTYNADGVTYNSSDVTHLRKYPSDGTGPYDAADTRKFHVHVYFVAPCSFGNGANGVCDGSEDSDKLVPTLKRLELSSDGANAAMSIVPLVEGIEYFKMEYGIDNTPPDVDPGTGSIGDGVPDSYVAAPTAAQWPNVVTVRVHLLARNVKSTDDYTDDKTYTLAGTDFGPWGGSAAKYKRHVFSTEVRPMNVAGRREIPE